MAEQNRFEHDDDGKLDKMLEAMLSAYSTAEPRPGLQTRILANLKEESAQRGRKWNFRWTWAGTAMGLAALILLGIYFSRPQQRPAVPEIATHRQQQEAPAPALKEKPSGLHEAAASDSSSRQRRTRIAKLPRPDPKEMAAIRQDVFPSPSPLSEQEKLLLRYLARTPQDELIAQSRPDPPDEVDDNESRDGRPQNLIQIPQRSSNTK